MTNRTDIQQKLALNVEHVQAIATLLAAQDRTESFGRYAKAKTNLESPQSEGARILIDITVQRWSEIFNPEHDENLAFAYCQIIKKQGYEPSDHLYIHILERLQHFRL